MYRPGDGVRDLIGGITAVSSCTTVGILTNGQRRFLFLLVLLQSIPMALPLSAGAEGFWCSC